MDRLSQRADMTRRALGQLDELTGRPSLAPIERDAALQRFEYSCEALALDIAARLPAHAALLRAWLERIEARVASA